MNALTSLLFLAVAAASITLSPPQTVAEFDTGKVKGDLARLAWSDDGAEFYVQTVERDRAGNPKAAHHYLVSAASHSIKESGAEPPWAAKYWQWKSAQASPAAASFKIDVSERTETKRAVSAPTGGDLARGGIPDPAAGTSLGDVANATNASQTLHIFTLTAKNEPIGEWVNAGVTPGTNFSWAPAPLQFLAFAKRDGGTIIVLDAAGAKQELAGTRSALLPAWSPDGKRIAWLERKGKKYQLAVSGISVQ